MVRFCPKVKRLVRINSDQYREYFAHLVLGSCIELLAELHDVDTFGTQCRADGRCRVGLTAFTLQLYETRDFFCHCNMFFW